jgi:hypothetical protein
MVSCVLVNVCFRKAAFPKGTAEPPAAGARVRARTPPAGGATVDVVTAEPADGPAGARRAGPLDRALRDLTDDQRRSDAVAARRREQWLRRQSEEEGTFHGVLTDLAERGPLLAVRTRSARVARGSLCTLGHDFLALRGPTGERTVIPLAVVTSVHPEPGTQATVGDRAGHTTQHTVATLDVALAGLAADRPPVTVHTAAGDRITGRLWWVGRDVAAVRVGNSTESYIPLNAVNDLTLG